MKKFRIRKEDVAKFAAFPVKKICAPKTKEIVPDQIDKDSPLTQYQPQVEMVLPPEKPYRSVNPNAKFGARTLVETAMMVAISVLLAFLNNMVPFFGLLGPFLMPIPFAVLVLRQGLGAGVMAAVCNTILLSLPDNPIL